MCLLLENLRSKMCHCLCQERLLQGSVCSAHKNVGWRGRGYLCVLSRLRGPQKTKPEIEISRTQTRHAQAFLILVGVTFESWSMGAKYATATNFCICFFVHKQAALATFHPWGGNPDCLKSGNPEFWKSGYPEFWDLEIQKCGIHKYPQNSNFQNENACRLKCRQGLD